MAGNLFDRLAKERPAESTIEQQHKDPAQRLLTWLPRWRKPTITPRDIRIYGPKYFRTQERVLGTAETLVRHGWLTAIKPRGKNTHEWQVVRRPVIDPQVGL